MGLDFMLILAHIFEDIDYVQLSWEDRSTQNSARWLISENLATTNPDTKYKWTSTCSTLRLCTYFNIYTSIEI